MKRFVSNWRIGTSSRMDSTIATCGDVVGTAIYEDRLIHENGRWEKMLIIA
jgi:hypothetical protein